MTKIVTTLTLDEGLIKTLKTKKINISGLVNDFLVSYLNEQIPDLELKQMKEEIMNQEAKCLRLKEKLKIMEEEEKHKIAERGIPFKFGNQY